MPSLVETIAIAMEQAARGRLPQAMEDLRRQLPQHPDSADLHHSIGVLALRSGQLDQGLFHFERAAGLGRPRADYISNYATALNIKGRTREAAEQFATDADSRLAGIRRANQGVFEILARDQAPGISQTGQLEKTVRVVSTIEYSLE